MNTLPSDPELILEAVASVSEPNQEQIDRYMALSPRLLIRVASQLGGAGGRFDAARLLDQAADLVLTAKQVVRQRRTAMLADMGPSTLVTLATQRRQALERAGESDEEIAADPAVAEYSKLVASLVRREAEISEHERRQRRASAEAVVSDYERSSTLERPLLPVSLEVALRFVTGDNITEWEVVQEVFRDFLEVDYFQNPHIRQANEETAQSLKRQRSQLAKWLKRGNSRELANGEVSKQKRESLDHVNRELEMTGFRRQWADSFSVPPTPETKPPDRIRGWESLGRSLEKWSGSDAVCAVETLAWLIARFVPFWNQHSEAYYNRRQRLQAGELERQHRMESEIETKKAPKRKGGTNASTARESRKLTSLAEAFIRWAKDRPITRDLIEEFPKSAFGIPVREKRGREFLTTLWAIKEAKNPQHELTIQDLQQPLSKVGITISDATLKSAFRTLTGLRVQAGKISTKNI